MYTITKSVLQDMPALLIFLANCELLTNDKSNGKDHEDTFVKTPKLSLYKNFIDKFSEYMYFFKREETQEIVIGDKVHTYKEWVLKGGANIIYTYADELTDLVTDELKSYLNKAAFDIKRAALDELKSSAAGCHFETTIRFGNKHPQMRFHIYIDGKEITSVAVRPEIYQEDFNKDLVYRIVTFIKLYRKAQKLALLSDAISFDTSERTVTCSSLDVTAKLRLKGSHSYFKRFLSRIEKLETNLPKLNANYKKVCKATENCHCIYDISVGEEHYRVVLTEPNFNGDYIIEGKVDEVHPGLFQHSSLRFLKAG